MTESASGSCLCGTVRFEISGGFEKFFLCHCSLCRKGSGSAHAANLVLTTARLNWLSGQDCVRTYRVPESRHERNFCDQCGSALPGVHANGAFVVVPAGSVDSAIGIRPDAHICLASRAEWDADLQDVPGFAGLPG
nr:GFA family protein [Croceicoccus sediminis]